MGPLLRGADMAISVDPDISVFLLLHRSGSHHLLSTIGSHRPITDRITIAALPGTGFQATGSGDGLRTVGKEPGFRVIGSTDDKPKGLKW